MKRRRDLGKREERRGGMGKGKGEEDSKEQPPHYTIGQGVRRKDI